ncbi:MAG: hypothetical protein FJY85_08815 [Deltaproteobacteria bacterium]|nr:hypothetical protein [Deltaproteobacteria bacterium]
MREYRDASNRLTFDLSGQEEDFGRFAKGMISLHGDPIHRLDDPLGDQRYWDFNVEGTTVVLHSDVMAGVSIHVEDGSHEALLRDIVKTLTKDKNPQNQQIQPIAGEPGSG